MDIVIGLKQAELLRFMRRPAYEDLSEGSDLE